MQAPHEPPSRRHWKLDPPSVAVNENQALVALVGSLGLAVIEVSGAVVSTVQVYEAGEPSVLPAASLALTLNVWLPSARPP